MNGKIQDNAWERFPVSGLDFGPEARFYLAFKAVDMAGNTTYFDSQGVTLDGTAPVGDHNGPALDIVPGNGNLSPYGYYNGDVTVSVAVRDPEMGEQKVATGIQSVFYKIITNGVVTGEGTLKAGSDIPAPLSWNGTFTVPAEANNSDNVVLEVSASDCAGNWRTSSITIKIDVDAPVISASYDNNAPVATVQGISYFTGKRTLTVEVKERNFNAAASTIEVKNRDTGKTVPYAWTSTASDTWQAVLPVTEDGDYIVTASITDLAGNAQRTIVYADSTKAADTFILDNTAPAVSVAYDNNAVSNGRYFNDQRTATITVVERNFEESKFRAMVEASGSSATPALSAWVHNGSVHTAHITFSQDGEYGLTLSCTDMANNASGNVSFSGAAPYSFVIDKTPGKIEISGVQDGASYAKDVKPEITVQDFTSLDVSVKLLRTNLEKKNQDVTADYIPEDLFQNVEQGKTALLDVFQDSDTMDGLYTLQIEITDMAGNTAQSQVSFAVNRHGSVYVYGDNLINTIGSYTQAITEDFTITEYNPSRLVAGSAKLAITRNGSLTSMAEFSASPAATGKENPGPSGWYEYVYTISKDNFMEDGVYTIILSTQDEAGNYPETKTQEITFSVDTTAPELTSVVGLEREIVNAASHTVSFTAADNVALQEITVYAGDTVLAQFTDLDGYGFDGTFEIPEGLNQHIRLVLKDKAGNVLDTDNKAFTPGYSFRRNITVSANFFLRWYANTTAFVLSLIFLIALVILTLIFIIGIKKRKAQSKNRDKTEIK